MNYRRPADQSLTQLRGAPSHQRRWTSRASLRYDASRRLGSSEHIAPRREQTSASAKRQKRAFLPAIAGLQRRGRPRMVLAAASGEAGEQQADVERV